MPEELIGFLSGYPYGSSSTFISDSGMDWDNGMIRILQRAVGTVFGAAIHPHLERSSRYLCRY